MKKLTTGLIGLLLALVLCVSLLPVTAQATDTPSVESWNIALKDNIVVNFNVNVPDVSNTTISATVNGAAVETSQSVSGNICTVSVSLAAAQLNDSIQLFYNVNGTQSESREFTAKEYADALLNDTYFTSDVAVKQMASQMLSYGGAAQTYFNYNTDALANTDVDDLYANVTLPTDVPAVSVSDSLDKVGYYGTSLVFRSQVFARFYFTMDDRNAEINNYTVTINGEDCTYGKFYDPQGRFNYFADSPGITPNNYDQQLEVVITDTRDQSTMTISYSPLNYIVNKASSSTANLPELMKAMYGYHVESCEYMNYENAVGITFKYKDTDDNIDNQGYGTKGIEYENSVVNKIFAVAPANSMPVAQDYYPQSADCIKLVRNGETTSVADVTKAAIQKRSEDAYHIYATNLTVELQDQDVLIVEGKFSTDRADTYYDGETMNIAKAYVYVDLSYEEAATITSAEPLLWQTVNVGPFYTHSQSNSYTESQQKPYRYMAADENDMPFEDNCWDYAYMATGNVSLTYVQNGASTNLSTDGLLIKKWGAKDYYIEGGPYDTTTLQNGEYYILEGQFKNDTQRTVINVAKTYIYKDAYNGEIFIAGDLPQGWQVVDVGPFYTHSNSHLTHCYMAADTNAAPYYPNWDYPYYFTDSTSLTYVYNGVSTKLDTTHLMIKKYGANDYYLEGGEFNSTALQKGGYFILEGLFEQHNAEKYAINVLPTYIYKDSHSGEVTIAGTLPSDIPCIEWLAVGQNDSWIGGYATVIENTTHYDDGVYASFPTINATHGGGTWGCTYTSTSVDNVKIIRNGVTTSISLVGGSSLDMYNQNYMYIKFHTRWSVQYTDANGNPSPLQAGDILIIEGLFKHTTTGEKIWIEKSYITMLEDGTTAFSAEMPVSHTVNLDANGGSCSTTSLTTTTGGKVTLPDATRTHYTFGGWSDGTTTYAAGTKLIVNSDMTLTALWTINQYTVNYSYNGGSGSPASATVNAGSAVTLPTPTRANYTFNGWSDGSNTYAGGASYTVNGNVTLTAQWTPIEYTVTYNYNGGSGSTTSATGTVVTAVTLPTPNARDSYRFNGWYTAASGGTKVGDASASYTPTGTVTLYAQWTQLYTITVSEDGGSFARTDSGSLTNIAAGESVTGTITYENNNDQSFTVKDANGNDISYTSSGDTITFTMPASNVTITVKSTECIAEGTMITLADGSQKKVEDLTMEDRLLSFNHETGEYIETAILFIEDDGSNWYNVINLEFANGATTRLIYEHALYDLDLNKYVYIDEQNYADYVGHQFAQQDGTATELLNAYITNEYVGCYSLVTDYHLNYFIEGMFSIPGGIGGLFNIFDYDENMVYDAQKMADDIETYGLFTYEDFADYGVSEEMFNAFPTKYLKVSIGKGYITMERIEYLIQRYSGYFQ